MQLTVHADYSLRLLLYLALHSNTATLAEISDAYGISRNHLVKVAQSLKRLGYIDTARGREGGLSLLRDPEEVRVGEVLRQMEPSFNLLECFDEETNTCPIIQVCALRTALWEARSAFFAVLDEYTLADLLSQPKRMRALLGVEDG